MLISGKVSSGSARRVLAAWALPWRRLLWPALAALVLAAGVVRAERVKDLVSVQGVRPNQLIGYGVVVGLDGSGDQTTQTPFTVQSVVSMLAQMGVSLPPGTSLQLKNVAAVMVTSTLPAFARPGQTLDVTVSSIGNAKSLRGGTLLLAPLKGLDGQIYAMAQGNVLVGGAGAQGGGGSSAQINHLSAGRVPAGATVERSVPTPLGQGDYIDLEAHTSDFALVHNIANAINAGTSPGTALARDGRVIRLKAPSGDDERVGFLAKVGELAVVPVKSAAKVLFNARTGSVVMNQSVNIEACAVAHGNLSVIISNQPVISQPNPLAGGQTVQTQSSQVEIRADKGEIVMLGGASLGEVVKALNAIGATPQDLLAILQAIKAAGALRAELEVI
ncbi:MAG: flagellar basal body P-ring protein FlgI [Betaproteobacteria bacterium]|nr:flagellar basal body P-ring protein FlgI [Betaproteobacteria bacterium]